MINIHKKGFNSQNFGNDPKLEKIRTDQKMFTHKQTKKQSFYITENEETIIHKEIVLGKSKSYFEMTTLTLKRQFRSFYERKDPQEQFENLFPGCRDWAISSVKLTSKNSLEEETEESLQQRSDLMMDIDQEKVENLVQNFEEQIRNSSIDYDEGEWFDTDCSQYESEISLSTD